MEQINSFVVLILHFSLHTLVLYVLKTIHLELVTFSGHLSSHVACCVLELLCYHLVFLGFLSG